MGRADMGSRRDRADCGADHATGGEFGGRCCRDLKGPQGSGPGPGAAEGIKKIPAIPEKTMNNPIGLCPPEYSPTPALFDRFLESAEFYDKQTAADLLGIHVGDFVGDDITQVAIFAADYELYHAERNSRGLWFACAGNADALGDFETVAGFLFNHHHYVLG